LGLIASIKNYLSRDKLTATKIIDLLNRGYSLIQINRALYDIPEIRMAINFIAEKVASVPFYHIRADTDNNQTVLNDRLHFVLTVRTNPYQGPQVFWTAAITTLLLTNNCFIMPDWGDVNGNIRAMYILPFTAFEFSQLDGRLIITFTSNAPYSFYYDDIIHLQRFPTQKGGAPKQATSNYTTIVSTMQAQAVKDSETSGRIAALLQVKSQLKGSDMKKKLDEFKELFLTAENTTGFGMIGAEYDVHKLDMSKTALDTNLLKSIIGYLYNYFGVSTEIISNTANELQYEQFVDNTIKPIVYQIEEELTYKLFSDNEIYHFNRVQAELVDLEISTLSAKTTFYKEMIFGSVMNRNEIRRRLGIPKGPPELDEFALSKNFETLNPGNYVVEDAKKGGENEDGTGTDKEVPANSTAE
jgi:HK97 family phage portal protein